jgi:hypothetical protein
MAILDAIEQLEKDGEHGDGTKELYVFYSGHGLQRTKARRSDTPEDILVADNFSTRSRVADACVPFGEFRRRIKHALGVGRHFYFLNACRTVVDWDGLKDVVFGPPLGYRQQAEPVCTLFATAPGSAAPVRGLFGPVVLDGLHGRGRAKRWEGAELYVTFAGVSEYAKRRLPSQELTAQIDVGFDSRIMQVQPIVNSRCDVIVLGALPTDMFELSILDLRGKEVKQGEFTGDRYAIPVEPDDYHIRVAPRQGPELPRIEPPPPGPVDLFDSATVRFRRSVGPVDVPPAIPPTSSQEPSGLLDVQVPPGGSVRAVRIDNGEILSEQDLLGAPVSVGMYHVELLESGFVVSSERVQVRESESTPVFVGTIERDGLRAQLQRRFRSGGSLKISEGLSHLLSPDVATWLSVIGASRVVGSSSERDELGDLNMMSFDAMGNGASTIYVLLGGDAPNVDQVVVLDSEEIHTARAVAELSSVGEVKIATRPGPHRLVIGGGGGQLMSIVTHTVPNQVTLVVVVQEEDGTDIRQLILPVRGLISRLPPAIRTYLNRPMLPYAYWSATVQKRFARFQSIAPDVPPPPDDANRPAEIWQDQRDGRWLDPMSMILYAFDTLRRRSVDEARGLLLGVIGNLRTYFPGIPDTEAIAKVIGAGARPTRNPTLLLEGTFALGETPANPRGMRLDYEGMWTLWRGEESEAIELPPTHVFTTTVSPYGTAGAAKKEEAAEAIPG